MTILFYEPYYFSAGNAEFRRLGFKTSMEKPETLTFNKIYAISEISGQNSESLLNEWEGTMKRILNKCYLNAAIYNFI